MSSNKIIALGKEVQLAQPMDITRENIISILRDLDIEIARELENTEFSMRNEKDVVIIYRDSAVFG